MNPRNDGRNVQIRSATSRGWLCVAVGGVALSAIVVGVSRWGMPVSPRNEPSIVDAAPDQSEPELESGSAANRQPRPPVAFHGHIELTGHEVDALDDAEMEVGTVPQSRAPAKGRPQTSPRAPFYTSVDLDELQIAEAAAARGKWAEAEQAYAEITMNPPVPIQVWYHRAIACLKSEDTTTYRELCASMLDRVEMNPLNIAPVNLVAWMCALGPDAIADPRRAVVLAEFLLAHLPDEPAVKHAYLNTIGGVYLRAGRYADAVTRLKEGIATTNDGGTKQDWLLLALAYEHLGLPADARKSLARMPSNSPLNRPDIIWDIAEIELLQQEVERALAPRPN